MFGLSFPELLIVLVVALIVLGPERLPKVARMVGKGMREVRKATIDFKDVVEGELYQLEEEIQKTPGRQEAKAKAERGGAPAPAPAEGAVQAAPPARAVVAGQPPAAGAEPAASAEVEVEDRAAEPAPEGPGGASPPEGSVAR